MGANGGSAQDWLSSQLFQGECRAIDSRATVRMEAANWLTERLATQTCD